MTRKKKMLKNKRNLGKVFKNLLTESFHFISSIYIQMNYLRSRRLRNFPRNIYNHKLQSSIQPTFPKKVSNPPGPQKSTSSGKKTQTKQPSKQFKQAV